jgi:quinoprotein relay system zinc metallohydrolase 2
MRAHWQIWLTGVFAAGRVVCKVFLATSLLQHGTQAAAALLEIRKVAEGVYVHAGRHEESSVHNHGDIANIGFVVGARCVAVIDSGGSLYIGMQLRESIRKVTPLPVCYVINTHMHPDHVLGNAAFLGDHPHFVGHQHLPAALTARRSSYLQLAQRQLGEDAKGSEVVLPDTLVSADSAIDLGDRVLHLQAWPTAHTDNDLTVLDESTGTLWLGDLLFLERIPVIDGSLRGWLDVLTQLRSQQPVHVVPGHGRIDAHWPEGLDREAAYLTQLRDEIRTAIRTGKSLQDTIDHLDQKARNDWQLYDDYHKRNATAAFAELEWE